MDTGPNDRKESTRESECGGVLTGRDKAESGGLIDGGEFWLLRCVCDAGTSVCEKKQEY